VAVGAACYVVLGRFTSAAEQRRRQLLVAGLPQACDLLAVAVAAGLPVRVAVERVAATLGGPVGDALGGVAARVRLGVPEPEAWAELASQPGLEALAREVSRVVSSGVGIVGLLRELARDARLAAASDAQVRAKRVGVRSVLPLMLCFLPAFVLLGIVPVFGGIVTTVFP
jgi:pilus assembly protein TadC